MQAKNFIITGQSSEKTLLEITEMNEFLESVSVKQIISNQAPHIYGKPSEGWWIMVFYEKVEKKEKKEAVEHGDRESPKARQFNDVQKNLYSALKVWRKDRAKEVPFDEFDVFPNHLLESIVAIHPQSILALTCVSNMTKAKVDAYGDDILAICNAF